MKLDIDDVLQEIFWQLSGVGLMMSLIFELLLFGFDSYGIFCWRLF